MKWCLLCHDTLSSLGVKCETDRAAVHILQQFDSSWNKLRQRSLGDMNMI